MFKNLIIALIILFILNILSVSLFSQVVVQRAPKVPEISTPKIDKMVDVGGRKLNCNHWCPVKI